MTPATLGISNMQSDAIEQHFEALRAQKVNHCFAIHAHAFII
jgi:hypothetical protein